MNFFFSQHNGVVSPSLLLIVILWFLGGFLIVHECDHSFGSLLTSELLCWAIIFSPYTPPQKPAYGLVLCSGDNTVNGDRSCSDSAPLSPLLTDSGPLVKIRSVSLYDGATLIAPEDGNTRRIWRPPRCGHQWSGYRPRCNRLATEAYPRLILPDGRKYREWRAIPKVRLYSQVDSGLPPGRGYHSVPEVVGSAKVHWQVQWLWITCLLLYF